MIRPRPGPRPRAHRFGRHDRIVIDSQTYRTFPEKKQKGIHLLQLVTDDIVEDFFITKSDTEISELMAAGRLRRDEGHFSQVLSLLRVRQDTTDLSDIAEDDLLTMYWKLEWCGRFYLRMKETDPTLRLVKTYRDLEVFIAAEKDEMDRWFLDRFGKRRPPGPKRQGEIRKAFDYPSEYALMEWLTKWRKHNERIEAFIPQRHKSGRRNQLDPRIATVIESCVRDFPNRKNPKMVDIIESVDGELELLNAKLPKSDWLTVSETTVRTRVHKIDPFIRDFGRLGQDRTLRAWTAVGMGNVYTLPLQRVEMDDWEVDLQSLVESSKVWKSLSPSQRQLVPRCRCTFTVAIDVATKVIVGFNASAWAPSAATSKAALRSTVIDKTASAKWAGCESTWDMFGRPEFVATDGGPPFQGEFEIALRLCLSGRSLPEQDPRMRGTIEAFFRLFKRLCRYFAGQTFSNVVEKGDYPSEEMASVTFEGLLRAAIVFIVDHYHHRKHRGLGGRTPYAVWQELAATGLDLPLSSQQVKAAFGFRNKARIDKHGTLFETISYNSPQLADLHRMVGSRDVTRCIDPENLTSILVRVPEAFRDRFGPDPVDWLEVPSVDGGGDDRTLSDVLAENTAINDLAKQEQEAGRPYRLSAHRRLMDEGRAAEKAAGLPSHAITQKQFDAATKAMRFKENAALGSVKWGDVPLGSDPAGIGETVAHAAKRRSTGRRKAPAEQAPDIRPTDDASAQEIESLPYGGGTNLYGEDE